VFRKLIRWSVDTVIGRQRCRQYKPNDKDIFTLMLKMIRQNIRSVGPEIRTEIIARWTKHQLIHVFNQLMLAYTPGEVGVRLCKPTFGKRSHNLRPRKGFR